MSDLNSIREDLLRQLEDQAKGLGCDINDLLERWLTQDESPPVAQSRHFREQLLDSVGQALIATDLEGRITYWNKRASTLYGWSEEEVLGKNIVDITPSDLTQSQAQQIMEQLSRGESWQGEFLVKKRDGESFMALVTDFPVYDAENNLAGIIGASIDISHRKQLESELLASEARLQSLLDSQTAYVVRVNTDGEYTYANKTFQQTFGWVAPDRNLIGVNSVSGVHPDDVQIMIESGEKSVQEVGKPVSITNPIFFGRCGSSSHSQIPQMRS